VLGKTEAKDMVKIRRSIVAARDLRAGVILCAEDLTWVRPGDGIAPGKEDQLIGRKLTCAVERGEAFSFGQFTNIARGGE
jgi:sialic acid synthase SpsE